MVQASWFLNMSEIKYFKVQYLARPLIMNWYDLFSNPVSLVGRLGEIIGRSSTEGQNVVTVQNDISACP